MKEGVSYTPEEATAMGYDPAVVDFFKQNDPDLLEFMLGNGSAHYQSILKNEIENADLIRTALLQVRFEGRIGNTGLSSLLMAEFRLTHSQNPAIHEEEKKGTHLIVYQLLNLNLVFLNGCLVVQVVPPEPQPQE